MKWWQWALLGAAGLTLVNIADRYRHRLWREAVGYCRQVNKPILRIGMKRTPWEPPNGDVTLDLDPAVTAIPGGIVGDERKMPFHDKEFGVCFNSHTLEHLTDRASVEAAVRESVRVADYAVLIAPSAYSFSNIWHPTHNLRLWFKGTEEIVVKPNNWQVFPLPFNLGGDASEKPAAQANADELQTMILHGTVPRITS